MKNLRFLRRLVDLTWNDATESTTVPSTERADRLIEQAKDDRRDHREEKEKMKNLKVTILLDNPDEIVVDWRSEDGFGRFSIKYVSRGCYTVDSEYIGMNKTLQIIAEINNLKKDDK